jgi:hypothetical protein
MNVVSASPGQTSVLLVSPVKFSRLPAVERVALKRLQPVEPESILLPACMNNIGRWRG